MVVEHPGINALTHVLQISVDSEFEWTGGFYQDPVMMNVQGYDITRYAICHFKRAKK